MLWNGMLKIGLLSPMYPYIFYSKKKKKKKFGLPWDCRPSPRIVLGNHFRGKPYGSFPPFSRESEVFVRSHCFHGRLSNLSQNPKVRLPCETDRKDDEIF